MNNVKSHTVALLPILVALDKFKERGIEAFSGKTEDQKFLLSLQQEALEVKLMPEQIKSFISESAAELNRILKENGFSIELDEKRPFDLGVVTIMDLIGKWQGNTQPATITYSDINYPGVTIKAGACTTPLYSETGEEKDLLMIRPESTSGLVVFIENNTPERSGLELFKYVYSQAKSLVRSELGCDAIIPFVSIDDQPDISFIEGLPAIGTQLVITQALQQNKLSINLEGIHAESAVALGAARGIAMQRKQVFIDKPFTLWIAYANPTDTYFPLYAAYVHPTNWKDPGNNH